MEKTVLLLRRKTRTMSADKFAKLGEHLRIKGKPLVTDDAVMLKDDTRAVAYAQSCGKLAGLLFYADQSVAWGEVTDKVVADKRARDWAGALLEKFDLLPTKSDDRKITFDFALTAAQTEAVVFDGKARKRVKAKTDVGADIAVNGLPVVGPRGKVRMIFKTAEQPVMMHVGLWESLSVYEERELVSEHDVVRTVRDKLESRSECGQRNYDVRDVRLVYFAHEFAGGPDLLSPWYFVEVELRDPRHDGPGEAQGPRQVMRIPAYR